MAWDYSQILKEHFMNPKNFMEDEENYTADGLGYVGSPQCGDYMKVWIKVKDNKLEDFKWQTYGCASAIASTSILSEIAIGMSVDEAYNITPEIIAERLGGLPSAKVHCSVLGDKALKMAINDYYEKNGMTDKITSAKEQIICQCLNITDSEIEHYVLHGITTFDHLQESTKIGTSCGKCIDEAKAVLRKYVEKHASK